MRLGRILAFFGLISLLFLPSCGKADDPGITVIDPLDELAEELQLTEEQVEKLRTGTGTLQLTAEQVDLLRDTLEQVLEEPENEEWLGETRWQELQDIYDGVLAQHEVDLQRVGDLASDIYSNLEEEPELEVLTSLWRASEEEVRVVEAQGTLAITTTSTVFTPRGTDEGDRDYYPTPWINEWKRGWANAIGHANAESGAVGVHADSGLGLGSAAATACQRILIHVPYDSTDVGIEATIEYKSATVHVFTDVSGTYTTHRDLPTNSLIRTVIDPLLGWTDAAEKLLAVIPEVHATALGLALFAQSLSDLRDVVALWGDCSDYELLRESLEEGEADERVVTHSADSLPAGYYWFEVGLRARAISILLSASGAVAIGQVTQIKVTQEFEEQEPVEPAYIGVIAAGKWHTVGLKSDGTVVAVGGNTEGQCNVGNWTDIIQVAAAGDCTVGLKSDGTVVAVGSNSYGQGDVSGWGDIVQVAAGDYHTVGLRSDGRVFAVGSNSYGQCSVSGWTDIVQVATGYYHTVGLKSDGTVVAVGDNTQGQCDVGGWTDIIQVAPDYFHTVGLESDGTVVAVGWNSNGQCDVGGWTDIVQVAAGAAHTVGLQSYDTVAAVGDNYYGQCNTAGWMYVVQVAAGYYHTVGLRFDGTVVAVGLNSHGQCNVSGWTGIG